jgi:cytochrome P450
VKGWAMQSPMREIDDAIAQMSTVSDAPGITVTDYEDILHVLRSQDFVTMIPACGHGSQWNTLLTGDSVVTLAGDAHFARRRLLMELFKKAELLEEYEQQYLIPAFDQAIADLKSAAACEFDLVPFVRKLLVRVVARLVGLDGLDNDHRYEEFEATMARAELGVRSKFAGDAPGLIREALEAQARLADEYFAPAWDRRAGMVDAVARGEAADAELKNDLITLMIRHADHYEAFGSDAAFREATLLLIAAVGSTTNAICFAVWDLHQWLRAHPEDEQRRTDADFMRACFAESLRLTQTNTIHRTAIADSVLPSGLRVAAGEVALLDRPAGNASLASAAGCPVKDDGFDPHRGRFGRVPQYGLAFGGGAHMCLGKNFAVGAPGNSGQCASRYEGVGMRIFLAVDAHRIAPDPTYVPDWDDDLPDRPTWLTLPGWFPEEATHPS